MNSKVYDAIVIGLGAMGSATVYQLAKSGMSVLGMDQYNPPHTFGSSHGETRITRQAIAEGQEYVPLVLRANEIWQEIEAETGQQLYTKTGILIMASNSAESPNKFVNNTTSAAKQYDIEHSELNAEQIRHRFPQFELHGDEMGYFEDGAGFLNPEVCVKSQLELANKYGAELQTNETFLSYKRDGELLIVTTNLGEYRTAKLVLTVGPWVQNVMPNSYKSLIKIYGQVLYWFEIKGDASRFAPGTFPVFNWEFNTAHEDFIYGFPSLDGRSIKVATEQYNATTTPDQVNRTVSFEETQAMYEHYIRPHFKDVTSNCLRAEACIYSVAPDWRFLIDAHPDDKDVFIASPCSGHGFKHSAAIGEVLSQLVQFGKCELDISSFSFEKLGSNNQLC